MICDGRFRGEADIHDHVASTASAVDDPKADMALKRARNLLSQPREISGCLRTGTGCDDMVGMTPTGNVGKHMLCGPRTRLLLITLAPTAPDSSRIA
jgi:hypothetical protein